MFGKTKSLFLIVVSMLYLASCDSIREDLPRCELWLEFTFDYNMEYADAFNPQVKSVDVLVFDSDDKLLFSKRAEAAALIGGNRMSLTDELEFGSYKVLTVGSLSDNFRCSFRMPRFLRVKIVFFPLFITVSRYYDMYTQGGVTYTPFTNA